MASGHKHKKIYPLPQFTGKPEEWQCFIEAFNDTTTEFEYSNLHNIMRLRDAISGKARETVEALLTNSANVPAILEMLQATYGRPEQLMRSQIERIRKMPPIAENSFDQLIDFANKINNMATFLSNANGSHHLNNPTLLSEIVAKMPVSRQLQWGERCIYIGGAPNLVQFSEWVSEIRRVVNMVSDSLPSASGYKRPNQVIAPNVAAGSRRYVNVVVAENKCSVCEKNCKATGQCEVFKSLNVDMRLLKVKELKLCFCCLKRNHISNKCFKKKRCNVNGCKYYHHELLHKHSSAPINADKPETTNIGDRIICHVNEATYTDSSNVLFQVMPVNLYNNGVVVSTYAFVDDGANVTIIDKQIAEKLNVKGFSTTLDLQWMNSAVASESSEVVELMISGVNSGDPKYKMANVFTSSNLSLPTQTFIVRDFSEKYSHLAGLPLASYSNVKPKLIISLAHSYLTVPMEVPKTGLGPIAVKTRLGWIAYGPTNFKAAKSQRVMCFARQKSEVDSDDMNELISSYFCSESFGVKANNKTLMSSDDEFAMSTLDRTTKLCENSYEVALLWKKMCPPFRDSYAMAMRRLETLERKISRDVKYAEEYIRKMDEYIKKGYAVQLSVTEALERTDKTFYIPHFGVKHPIKKNLRIVFDAAAEIKNISLNKMLLPGPDINQSMISILFKFRQAPIAITGDIQEMFLQIRLRREDCCSQRFLWRCGDPSRPVETYEMRRVLFGSTCSPTIAQYVKNVNAKRFEQTYPRAVAAICDRHYVDDYGDCFQTEEEAIKTVKEVIVIHRKAGFKLRQIQQRLSSYAATMVKMQYR